MEHWFSYGGRYSPEIGVILTATPKQTAPERDTETVSVPGRNGDLTLDNGRWKNVKRTYACTLLPNNRESYREQCAELLDLLCPSAGYSRLEDSFDPSAYRLARVTGGFSISSIQELAGEFEVTFDCKPQRFLKSGESAVTFSAAGTITNPTNYTALPLVSIYGSGAGIVTIGGVNVSVLSIDSSPLVLDCEMLAVADTQSISVEAGTLANGYQETITYTYHSNSSAISASELFRLEPGGNAVNWTGNITSVKIQPRWWTL